MVCFFIEDNKKNYPWIVSQLQNLLSCQSKVAYCRALYIRRITLDKRLCLLKLLHVWLHANCEEVEFCKLWLPFLVDIIVDAVEYKSLL